MRQCLFFSKERFLSLVNSFNVSCIENIDGKHGLVFEWKPLNVSLNLMCETRMKTSTKKKMLWKSFCKGAMGNLEIKNVSNLCFHEILLE